MEKQKSFVEQTWQVGDSVLIGGKHGTIKLFNAIDKKVMVEHVDMHSGEKYKRNYPIDELPPYPTDVLPDDDTLPMADFDGETTPIEKPEFKEGDEFKAQGGTGATLKVGQLRKDGDYDCVVTTTSGKEVPSVKTADQIRSWEKKLEMEKNDKPDTPKEEEVLFDAGHERVTDDGSRLVVESATVREKYMCRIFNAKGGSFTKEMHWRDLEKWGEPKPEKKEPEVKIKDVVQAVNDEIEKAVAAVASADDAPTADTVVEDVPEPVVESERKFRTELLHEQFVIEDQDGVHMHDSSERLTNIVNRGWELKHVEHISLYMPNGGVKPFVRTTVYWTFIRWVEIA